MAGKQVQQIIGRAVVEPAYRTLLFSNPGKALEGYALTGEEIATLMGLGIERFDTLASELEERISMTSVNKASPDLF